MEVSIRPGLLDQVLRTAPWAMVMRGVFAVLLGILALIWPSITLAVLVVLFGIYAFVDGTAAVIASFVTKRYWPLLVFGLLGIGAGVATFSYPGITLIALYYIIAIWAILKGVVELTVSVAEPVGAHGRLTLGFLGVLSILFALLLFSFPVAGLLAVVWLLGFYFIVSGIEMIWFGVEARDIGQRLTGAVQH